jgi:hypothetical protein
MTGPALDIGGISPLAFPWNATRLGRVSASRSRPCPARQGAVREADRGLPLGETRPWPRGRRCVQHRRQRGLRQGPPPGWAETRAPGRRGSGPRPVAMKISSIVVRGLGPGRGRLRPWGANSSSRALDWRGECRQKLIIAPSSDRKLVRFSSERIELFLLERFRSRIAYPAGPSQGNRI